MKEGLKTFTVNGKRKKREKEMKIDDGVDNDAGLCLKGDLKAFTVKGKCKKRAKKLKLDEAEITYIQSSSTDAANQKICSSSDKENEDFKKPISELDLSKCQRCTPSYCLLPKECMRPTPYCKSYLVASVSNNVCISVPSTSDCSVPSSDDHSSSRKKLISEQEEKLNQLEDDLFELDLLLELVNRTINQVEELQDKLSNTIKTGLPFHLESYFTTPNLRCIEQLYGAHGLDALNALSLNTERALPAVLTRLKQKQEEWLRCRANIGRCCL